MKPVLFYFILGFLTWSFSSAGPPGNIRATVTSPHSVEVTWDQLPSANVTGYLISYTTTASYISISSRSGSVMVTGRSTTSVILTNLEEDTPYTITVQTVSSGTLSGNSDVVSVTTWTDVPSSPPQNVMVTSVNPSSLRVSWQPPPEIDHNGVIIGYAINYTRVGSRDMVSDTLLFGTTIATSGLVPFVDYSITVAAMTVDGTGPLNDPPVVQTSGQDRPTLPRSLMVDSVTNATLTLSWMTPDPPNGIITQYELRYRRCAGGSYTTLQPLNNEATHTVTGLAVNTEYCFRVRAYTVISLGPGPWTNEVRGRTYGPPTNVNAVTLSPRSIEVTWDPPVANADDVIGYIISYDGVEDFADDASETVSRSPTRATIDELEEFVSYDITVQAMYNTANVPTTSAVRVMTLPDVPDGPPRDITLMDTDPAMLSVTYIPPEERLRNGDVTRYVIKFARVGSNVSQMVTVDSDYSDVSPVGSGGSGVGSGASPLITVSAGSSTGLHVENIPGLVAFTNYSVEVAAVNVNGTGPFSDVVYGLSGQDIPGTAPRLLTTAVILPRLLTLSWMPPDTPNGIIIQYEAQYSVNSTTSLEQFTDTLMGTVEGLLPVTIYTIQIRAYTRVGAGPFSDSITVMTLPEPPASVAGITIPAQSISSSMLTISWMEPDAPNGVITHYMVFYLPVSGPYGPIMTSNRRKRQLAQDGEFAMGFTGTSGTLTNLNGSVTYRIQVSAVALYNGEELLGSRSIPEMITTSEGTPTEPRDIVATNVTQSSISLTWQRPDPPNGLITNFTVSYNAMETHFNQDTGQMDTFTVNNFTSVELSDDKISASLNLASLRPGTKYQFTIVAYTNVGPGPEAMISVSTLPDAPPTPKTPQLLRCAGPSNIEIEIQRSSDVNGPIIYYSVIVVSGGDETSSIDVEDIGPFNKEQASAANSNGQPYTYITGIVETNDISDYPYPYMVGDESRSNISGVNYENVRLRSNTMYALLVRAHTTDDLYSTSSAMTANTGTECLSINAPGHPYGVWKKQPTN
ncbi:protein sidekick-1-like [Dysidea avara]|uniref:protein sidekick-1-like n=1 Tax=Dysidea avara TaxID=196820 RepID=UPI0033337292